MRKLVGEALDAYQAECGGEGGKVKVRRLLALSSFPDMHSDMCICAEDAMAALICRCSIKTQRSDGTMDGGLRFGQEPEAAAPCSVGIIVDRGLGKQQRPDQSTTQASVVVVFIGGADDREALTLASFMCKQQASVRLTALRVVQNATAQARAKARTSLFESKSKRHMPLAAATTGQEELQAQADDKFFAEFYRKHVAGNKSVGYLEKHVADGAELVAVLRGMQGDYRLFVVGRGRDRNSVLTEGRRRAVPRANGDIIASSDFSTTASVLIVQQYDAKKHYKVIDEEFMPL
ncbi:hypothetical protein ZWY2020_051692 [Hordeum vulgare]|nr:hypothetical protein ZWY2020_051692 [Hordeum vulgare]